MKHKLLSDIVNDKKYNRFNINEKRRIIKKTQNTDTYKRYEEIIKTDMLPNEKNKYYRQYLAVAEMMFDVELMKYVKEV